MLKQIRIVLFDAVGTLIYPDPPVTRVYCDAGQRFGSSLTEQEIGQRFPLALAKFTMNGHRTDQSRERQRWRSIVKEVFQDVDQQQDELFESLWRHFGSGAHWSLYDDVPSTWRRLQQQGLIIGVASNFDDRLEGICQHFPPLADCRTIFWSVRLGFCKPDPAFFQIIAQQLDINPDQILLVGDDRENDYHAGRRAGWQSVLLDRSAQHSGDGVIHSLNQLPRWLGG